MQVQLSKYTVDLKDHLGWGDSEVIKAEMMSALRVNAELKQQVKKQADAANASGKPIGSDPFNLTGLAMDGKAILAARIKAAELCIIKIVDNNGQVIPFSQDWLYSMNKADGEKLMVEVDKLRLALEDADALETAVEGK